MDYTVLGRTGLRVSVAGLGAGGYSRLGIRTGNSEENAVRIIKDALAQGVNLVDTARIYGTEEIVGRAVKSRRDDVILCTKALPVLNEEVISPDTLRLSVEKSLKRLQTDRIDVFFLHGVLPQFYAECAARLFPVLDELRAAGKIRFSGITEDFGNDTTHKMLTKALKDDVWDVIMVGANMLNFSAARSILPRAAAQSVGTLIMYAVRGTLVSPETLRARLGGWLKEGLLPDTAKDLAREAAPLGFLPDDPDVESLAQAAYRFCRHMEGADVVLTGTGNPAHLAENLAAICAPPLSKPLHARVEALFGGADKLTGN